MTTILFSQLPLAISALVSQLPPTIGTLFSQLPPAIGGTALIWYAAPLIVAISLVYGATRHEYLKEIVANAFKAALYLLVFLGAIFAVVWWASSKV